MFSFISTSEEDFCSSTIPVALKDEQCFTTCWSHWYQPVCQTCFGFLQNQIGSRLLVALLCYILSLVVKINYWLSSTMVATKALSFSFCWGLFRVEDVTEASATLRLMQRMHQYITNWSCRSFSSLLRFRLFLEKTQANLPLIGFIVPPFCHWVYAKWTWDRPQRGTRTETKETAVTDWIWKVFIELWYFHSFIYCLLPMYLWAYKYILFEKSNFYLLIFKSVFYNKHFCKPLKSLFLRNHPALTGLNRSFLLMWMSQLASLSS